jgi:hypothetical protein
MQQLLSGGIEQPRLTTAQKKARAAQNKIDRQAVKDAPALQNPPRPHYEFPVAAPEEVAFRHGTWQAKRDKVRQALISVNVSNHALTAFDNCGAAVTIEWSKSEQRYRMRGTYCHCRHCEPCAKQKANIISRNLKNKLKDDKENQYRFITLTLRHSHEPLADQIERLYKSFKKLRSKPCWKATQTGGSASLEVKWNPKDRMWHPHLHIISQGEFYDKRDLSNEWQQCTGDSFIADIRVISDAKSAAYYVGKYITKGTNDQVWDDPDAAQEWITATKGVRTCATFGTWRGFALTKFVPTCTDWRPIASLVAVQRAAKNGEEWAIGIMINLMPSAEPEEVRKMYGPYDGGS